MTQVSGPGPDGPAAPAPSGASVMRSHVRRIALGVGLVVLLLTLLLPGLIADPGDPALLVGIAMMAALNLGTRSALVDRWLDNWVWVPAALMNTLLVAGTGGHHSLFQVGFVVVAAYAAISLGPRLFAGACLLLGAGLVAPVVYDAAATLPELLVDLAGYAIVTLAVRLLAVRSDQLTRAVDQGRRGSDTLFEDSPLPMMTLAPDGTVLRTNRASKDLVPVRERVVGQQLLDLLEHQNDRERMEVALAAAVAGEVTAIDLRVRINQTDHDIEATLVPIADASGAVLELFTFGRDVTEQRLAQLAILRRTEQRTALANIGMEALEGAPLDELLARATELIVSSLPADDSSVLVPDAARQQMTIRAYAGGDQAPWSGQPLPVDGSLAGHVFTSGQPFASDDFRSESSFPIPAWLLSGPIRSGLAVPVHTPDGPWGVLAAASTVPRAWTHDDRTFVQNVANVLGSAVQRERAARLLSNEEARFWRMADNAQDLVFRLELFPEIHVGYASASIVEMLGMSLEDLENQPGGWQSTVDVDLLRQENPDGLASVRDVASERVPLRHADGHVVWVEVRRSPVHDEDGRVIAIDGIGRDVTAARRARTTLEETLAKEQQVAAQLRHVDEIRDNFLAAVSHELRTPLASVLGFSETLERSRSRMDEGQIDLLIGRLSANARHLDSLLSDLLDLDRMRRSVLEPGRRSVELSELVDRVARTREGVGDRIILDTPPVFASIDPPMVERIVENLLSNALRHAGPEATIWLRVEARDQDVHLIVEDDGPGVPEEFRESIFLPFEQGPDRHEHAPGTGIGLSLVAQFAQLHGGHAWVTDRRGGGASFRVHLPDAVTDHMSDLAAEPTSDSDQVRN